MTQSHESFESFTGALDPIIGIDPILKQVEEFVNGGDVTAKSLAAVITVHDETGEPEIVVTLGYREDQTPNKIKVLLQELDGTMPVGEGLLQAAEDVDLEIICHSLLASESGADVYVIFLCQV